VQHRIATSRIQQEIREATQRERELLAAGTIETISEDTVDSKVMQCLCLFFQLCAGVKHIPNNTITNILSFTDVVREIVKTILVLR
jgi:hypothetical protein